MNRINEDTAAAREIMSVYMDGELPVEQRDGLLQHVKTGASARADWAVYHCIGDVLRSNDTSYVSPVFAQQLRSRLDAEPFLFTSEVAKAYAIQQMWLSSAWRTPVALVAGMAAVLAVGVMVFPLRGVDSQLPQTAQIPQTPLIQSIQSPKSGPDSREMAANERVVPSLQSAPVAASVVASTTALDGGSRVVSNEYLMAHRNYSTGLAMRGVVSHVRTAGYDGK